MVYLHNNLRKRFIGLTYLSVCPFLLWLYITYFQPIVIVIGSGEYLVWSVTVFIYFFVFALKREKPGKMRTQKYFDSVLLRS